MDKIGKWNVLKTSCLIIPDGEVAEIQLKVGNEMPLTFRIEFVDEEALETRISWETMNGKINLAFHGWKNVLGTSMNGPQRLGSFTSDEAGSERELSFLAAHSKIGKSNKLDLHFLMESGE